MAGATERSNDLVEDQDDVMLVTKASQRRQVVAWRNDHAGGHQDRLSDERGNRLGPLVLNDVLDKARIGRADLICVSRERRPVGIGGMKVNEPPREWLIRASTRAP